MDDRAFWQIIERGWASLRASGGEADARAHLFDATAELWQFRASEALKGVISPIAHALKLLPVPEARAWIDGMLVRARSLSSHGVEIVLCGESALQSALGRESPPPGLVFGVEQRAGQLIDPLLRCVDSRWRDGISREIIAAFANTARPDDEHLRSGDWPTDAEMTYFCSKDWREHDAQLLAYRRADLSFLPAAGFHYLLPAFLLGSLTHDELAEAVQFALVSSGTSFADARLALLDSAQRSATAAVFRYRVSWPKAPSWEHECAIDPSIANLLMKLSGG